MTKPTSAPFNDARRGFTLTELLVVIGIIVLLVGLLMPMISRAYREGERARVKADLQTIGTALEAFKQDHGNYPPDGYANLYRWLVAPGDDGDAEGANDHDANTTPEPGFRLRPGAGKVWGPYLQMDQWKLDKWTRTMLVDRYQKPILYYRGNMKAKITPPNGQYVMSGASAKPRYRSDNNLATPPDPAIPASDQQLMSLASLQLLAGDLNQNGMADPSETAITLPFLLISAGPDELFGPQPDISGDPAVVDGMDLQKCDDVTNFR